MQGNNFIDNHATDVRGVWHTDARSSYDYSDGDETERYISDVITEARDLSAGSQELMSHIKDWPTRYHLSLERALVYRSLEIPRDACILEVGSGCGAITRLLGERAGCVVAVESSVRRAAITKARVRDLSSVTVLCGSFGDLRFKRKFDLVVCNGVLEYAAYFTEGHNPHQAFIAKIAEVVSPRGYALIAIENKLGLRYFTGAPEDHTGVVYDGLEGYPRRERGPRTFGLGELQELLRQRFSSLEVLFPLPDYKFPVAVVKEALLREANCAELFAGLKSDVGTRQARHIYERLVWYELQKSRLIREFVNSLFLVCGFNEGRLFEKDWLGDVYSMRRSRKLWTRTRIGRDGDGGIRTVKERLEGNSEITVEGVDHRLVEGPWANGESIHTTVVRSLCKEGNISLEDRLRAPVDRWRSALEKYRKANGELKAEAVDGIWRNCFVEEPVCRFIDLEWGPTVGVDLEWLIYRTILYFVDEEECYVTKWAQGCRSVSRLQLMEVVGKLCGIKFGLKAALMGAERERMFLGIISGRGAGRQSFWRSRSTLWLCEPIRVTLLRQRCVGKLQRIVTKARRTVSV